MSSDQPEGFSDNWAYLKTELNWLERVLMLAIARQRKETKEVDRIAHSRVDKVTSHWWKGVISLEGGNSYDEYRKPSTTPNKSYQQQLEAQIQLSQKRGVVLALPLLCDRLQLSHFEKNLILMSLAPEVNRRYARLYRYLQGDDTLFQTDLPTVDLVLRLFCRNDAEWRDARLRLADSPLQAFQLCQLCNVLPGVAQTFLNQPIKLSETFITYLLSTQPTPETLERLLTPAIALPQTQPILLTRPPSIGTDLMLPSPLLDQLQAIGDAAQQIQKQTEGLTSHPLDQLGRVILLAGASGTGKKSAAEAIAQMMDTALAQVDLALVKPEEYRQVFQEIATQAPLILLIQSAHYWLKRSAQISPIDLNQFLAQRQSLAGITILTVEKLESVSIRWQKQLDHILHFPMPNSGDRLKLWQQSFPPHITFSSDIDWQWLAQKLTLSGGDIRAIAQTASLNLANSGAENLSWHMLVQALQQHGKTLKLSPATITQPATVPTKPKRTRKKTSQ